MANGGLPDTLSRQLHEDSSIELSCKSFEKLHSLIVGLVEDKQPVVYNVNSVTPFPTLRTIAQFAKLAYKDFDPDKPKPEIPGGWELLTTASNGSLNNGYHGAMFLHPKHYQVVISHRGTKLTNFGALKADLSGVVGNEVVPQMDTACTLAVKVASILKTIEVEKENGVHFQLFITGHSLGGWLAQITTFATEYLEIEESIFVKASSLPQGVRHAHTVTFESPGCKLMLSDMKKKLGPRYHGRQCSVKALDITSYLLNPNIINSVREHVGRPYSILANEYSEMTVWETFPGMYTLNTHKMDVIIKSLEQDKPKIVAVLDWPITSVSRYFSQWSTSWKLYVPMPIKVTWRYITLPFKYIGKKIRPAKMHSEDECELTDYFDYAENGRNETSGPKRPHYQTADINENKTSLHVFTEPEKEFLEIYAVLKRFPINCNSDVLFAVISNTKDRERVRKSLSDFTIENGHVHCDSVKLQMFIPYVQQLLSRHSEIIGATKRQSSEFNIRKELYQTEHLRFLESTKHLELHFNESFEQMNFNVWQVISEECVDTHITTAKIHQLVLHNAKGNTVYAMKLKQLLHVDRYASLEDLPHSSDMSSVLFIIECKLSTDFHEEACQLFESIATVVIKYPGVRFIFVTDKDDILTNLVQDQYVKLDISFRQSLNELKWDDLAPGSQNQLLNKKVVRFNGEKTCLNDLMTNAADECSKIIDSSTLNKLIRSEEVVLGQDPQRLSHLRAAFANICEEIPKTGLINALLHCPEESLFMVTCSSNITSKETLMRVLNIPKDHAVKLIDKVILRIGLDKDKNLKAWKSECHKNHDKIMFWLEVTADHVLCQQIYNPKFYFKRQLQLIDLKGDMKQILKSNKTTDAFVISNVTEKKELVQILEISEKELKDFLFVAPTEMEALQLFNDQKQYYHSVHWLKIDQAGHLIWYQSSGNLGMLLGHRNQKAKTLIDVDEETLQKDDYMYKSRIAIIAGAPGMGKSTTLTSLSEHINGWTIRRELSSCRQAITNLPSEELTLNNVIDFLMKNESECNVTPLFKQLLRIGLEGKTTQPIHLLFDGFDEIDRKAREGVVKLLQFLKDNTECRIWITTRSNYKEHLEEDLSVFAMTFKEVDKELQEKFLHTFWKVSHAVRLTSQFSDIDSALKQHATNLLDQAKKIFGKETSSFMGVPLQLRMLAEAYPPNVEFSGSSASTEISNFRNEADLFQRFMEKKFDVYFNEKIGFAKHVTTVLRQYLTKCLTEKHRILAFRTLFPDDAEKYLQRNAHNYNTCDLVALNQLGCIQSNPQERDFSFINRSFAEYFVADLILHWLMKPQGRHQGYPEVENFILSQIFLKPEHKAIRLFLNGLLVKGTEGRDVSKFYKDRIATLLASRNEMCNNADRRTAIYVVAEENQENLLEFLLSCFGNGHKDLATLLLSRDKSKKTVLFVIAQKLLKGKDGDMKKLPFAEQFLGRVKNFPIQDQKTLMLASCFRTAEDKLNPVLKKLMEILGHDTPMKDFIIEIQKYWGAITDFLKSVSDGNTEKAKQLLNDAGTSENSQIFRRYLISATNRQNKTALYLAAKTGNSEMVRLLILEGADINSNYDSVTPLHAAAESGHPEVVKQLLANGANVDIADNAQKAPLHYAVAKGNKEMVKLLLDKGASPLFVSQDCTFSCLAENFEMNAKTLAGNLPYCLFSKHIPEIRKIEMSDIADCYRMVIQKAAESFDPQGIKTRTNLAIFAKELCKNGNLEESLDVYHDVLKQTSDIFGPSHDTVMQTQISIAQILFKQGKYNEALPFYQDVYEKRCASVHLGPNHSETLVTKHIIAKIMSYQGKYEDALTSYQQISDNLQSSARNYCHDVLITKHNTAQLLAHMGRYAESLTLYKENNVKFSKSFKEIHPFTLITKLNIAQMLSNNGDYDDAIQYYDMCLKSKVKPGLGSDGQTFHETAKRDKEYALLAKSKNLELANAV